MTERPLVKICCIADLEEAEQAIAAGADVLGLVGAMPSGPGIITDEVAAEVAAAVPAHIETFLLSSETTAKGLIAHHRRVKTTAIQMVDALTEGTHAMIKSALPAVKLVQVIHVQDESSITQAQQAAQQADALLLDSGDPNSAIKELGGTGRTHDWSLSRRIVDSVTVPVYLAGGLNAANVNTAMDAVKPHGLDLCSSVRTDDRLDAKKLTEFMHAVRCSHEGAVP